MEGNDFPMKRPMATRRRKKLIPPSWHRWLSKRWQLLRGHWWFHLGVFALWRGRYQKAAQWLEKALAILGEDAFVRMQLSWAHWHLGHPVTARLHALRATEQLPHHAPAWVFAGKVLALRGKWGEAERALRQALLLSPKNFVASSWLALVLFQTQQPEEALQLLKRLPVVDEPYLQARLVLHLERLVSERGEGNALPLPSPPDGCDGCAPFSVGFVVGGANGCWKMALGTLRRSGCILRANCAPMTFGRASS
jgi:tetratricopeptide (TPR) repeat protein